MVSFEVLIFGLKHIEVPGIKVRARPLNESWQEVVVFGFRRSLALVVIHYRISMLETRSLSLKLFEKLGILKVHVVYSAPRKRVQRSARHRAVNRKGM